ncbi:MAG: gamma-glutamylcyclotransferase family protein [Promethearchaeota archaeon]|jgi:gamma-glutamylcyclotransferase (GGCT)/AIG2-like uncharacterized protein YtfP
MSNDQPCDRLFVYGTLQHNKSRSHLLKNLKYKNAILPNFRKISPPNLGYPIIIEDGSSMVEGEVYYNLDESLFQTLDIIESEGYLYHKILVNVKTLENESLLSYVYYPSESLIKSVKNSLKIE